MFKSRLYETMINGDLTKNEYKSLKAIYSKDSALISEANVKLQKEIEDTACNRHEQMNLIQSLNEFESVEVLDRKTVICFIRCIYIRGKHEIEIAYNHDHF